MVSSAKLMRRALLAALALFLFGAIAVAQSTTDGAIGGTVFDKTGAVVGNAKILVHNNGTNAEQTTTADSSGYYRVTGLQPGSYTVTISGGGLASFKAEQVIVTVGSITEVAPHLGVSGTAETVDVTAEAPQINSETPEFAGTVDQMAISNLPINGGRWSNFALLTPSVVSTPAGFGLLSFRGISSLLNNNTVDGADNNQAFFSEERGRTRAGYSTPKAAVEEFQVNTSNYSAEYGRSAGGVINTVSKSGTNQIHGEGYFYDRDNVWGAANRFTQINVPNGAGGFSPLNFKPTDWRKIAGFGVGGPVFKDKLFLFVAYDWYHRNFPGVGVTSNPNVFFAAPSLATVTTLAGRLGVTNAQATTIYNNDLAGLNTMLGQVQRTGLQNIVYPKLDWTINSKNHASFSFNRMRWSSPAGIQTAPTVTRGIASFGNDFVKDTWGVAKLDTIITNNFANQVRFQYGRDYEFEFSQPPTPYELANLVNAPTFTNPLGLPPTVSITNGFTFGVPNFLQRSRFPDESREQVADTMTWSHGKHTVKYGADVSHVNDNSQNLFNGFGSYSYSSLLNYFSDFNKQNSCAGKPCYSSFTQGLGLPGLEFTTNDYAFFVQDDWKFAPRLSFSFGLRYEYQQMPKTVASLVNPLVPQTGHLPRDQNNLGPRIGFAAQLTHDAKTVLRGGYGIYYGRIINSAIFNALIDTAAPGSQVSKFFTPSSPGAPVFPSILTGLTGTGSNVVFFDNHFQNPQIHEVDLTLEHEFGWNTVAKVSYLGSFGRELPGFADVNIAPSASNITYNVVGGGPIGTATLTEPLFTTRLNPAFGSMTDIFSGVNSRYDAFVVQVDHRFSHHLQFSVNYTRSRSRDFGQNESTFSDTNDLLVPFQIGPEKGTGIYDTPYRIVAHAIAKSPWKVNGWAGWLANDWEFAPIYQIQSGLPFSLLTAGTPPGGLGSSINGSGGANRIDVTGRNTFRNPGTWFSDLRLAKSFKYQEKYELELTGDFFNIANKQNVTQINNTGYIIGGNTLTFASATFGTINNSNSNFQYTPRQVQLGARIKF
ncbi:MAG TPA: carboxypeptidase regulatory-like domain-containing protein [Verrucomicrobiae bacterium]|jgi:hypothetical protein|nr:carboxypeptidase regulatory-like domain-containing protein [Verrucomicrobiae bacterium]